MPHDLSRRAFLKRGLAATAGLVAAPLLSSPGALTGPQVASPAPEGPRRRVLVIGAGLAGLAAAYELTQAGHGHPGWMQGALASGVRAAREVMGARA